MTRIKIVVGVALAAFLAMNILGATAIFGGMSAFERVGNFTEASAHEDDPEGEFASANRGPEFDRDDDDGFMDDMEGFEPPAFAEGFPGGPGFPGGKGKGPMGEGPGGDKGLAEASYAVQNANVSPEEAEEVALGEVSGQIVETKLEAKDGFPHYEIEVFGEGGQLYEVLVGAENGDVVGRKVEKPEDAYKISYLLDQASISRDEAEETATSEFPGRVIENKLDDKDGFAVWEIKTFDDGTLHEVEINAQNGGILAYETKGSF